MQFLIYIDFLFEVIFYMFYLALLSISIDFWTGNFYIKKISKKANIVIAFLSTLIIFSLILYYLYNVYIEKGIFAFYLRFLAVIIIALFFKYWFEIIADLARFCRKIFSTIFCNIYDFIFINNQKVIAINEEKMKEKNYISQKTIETIDKMWKEALEKNTDRTWKNPTSEETFCKFFYGGNCNSYKEILKKAVMQHKKDEDDFLYKATINALKAQGVDVTKLLSEI